MSLATDKAKLRWACRRGMWELDILLGKYLDKAYDTASASEQSAFVALLEEDDPNLMAWLVQAEPAKPELQTIVDQIRANGAV